MMSLKIEGNQKYTGGVIEISGAKNAALPILLATILKRGKTILHNLPNNLLDVKSVFEILKNYNIEICKENDEFVFNSENLLFRDLPVELSRKTRYSSLLIGILGALFEHGSFGIPGGCSLGDGRPLDIHIEGFYDLGLKVEILNENILFQRIKRKSNITRLRFPSVGATENFILFSVLYEGETIIENCAVEPEIIDLINFLNNSGANIILEDRRIKIIGVEKLKDNDFSIIPDRIEMGSFILLASLLKRDVVLFPYIQEHNLYVINLLQQLNVRHKIFDKKIKIFGSSIERIKHFKVETNVFPGFPTDLQPILSILGLFSDGNSEIIDNVYANRFAHIKELKKMGADISCQGNKIILKPANKLIGTELYAHDLRAGAAVLFAAIVAQGESILFNEAQIVRGYHNLYNKLKKLNIEIIKMYDN